MRKKINYIIEKLKYDTPLQTIINALKIIKIYIYPYYIYTENTVNTNANFNSKNHLAVTVVQAKEEDINQFQGFRDRLDNPEKYKDRFKRGDICIMASVNGIIVAFSWANLKYFQFLNYKYKLNNNEAYLYDAYTAPGFRGQRLAHLLRYHLYQIMKQKGITYLYSVSVKTNTSALRFKKNIHSLIIEEGLHINFFNRWRYHKDLAFEKSRVRLSPNTY